MNLLEKELIFLEERGHLIRIKEEIDPNLEMAALHLKVFGENGPALLFENIKGCRYRAISNLFGSTERIKLLFRDSLPLIDALVKAKTNPQFFLKHPFKALPVLRGAWSALPKKISWSTAKKSFDEISIDQLPLIKHWPNDGGAFVTLPQVYSEDISSPGWKNSNLGMYRIQLTGNEYILNREIGLHYQLHRGIGIHQTLAEKLQKPLPVSVFVGGPAAHSFAAVMPLPEGIPELAFAGSLANRRFRYAVDDLGSVVSTDADFVITGEVLPGSVKPEGPFGDHLGYYSLKHLFPLMKVKRVYAKKNAIWPFTVVGRPPQEDTGFGNFIHSMTGNALKSEIPGLEDLHAVDAAGVHPLLLAIGSERYTPYLNLERPGELLTIANRILGTGQLSLAKFLFIVNKADNPQLHSANIEAFFKHFLERVDWKRDLHFYTETSIDTLDYSGTGLNSGSKVVLAAVGDARRKLLSKDEFSAKGNEKFFFVADGILSCHLPAFTTYENAATEVSNLEEIIKKLSFEKEEIMMVVVGDDPEFISLTLENFLWVGFTRCNPSHDVYGVDSFMLNKHWGCKGPLILDARIKPHHAPVLELMPETLEAIQRFKV
jgi:4-hydroxy-3-polyprenylbenzoate decarboxylase